MFFSPKFNDMFSFGSKEPQMTREYHISRYPKILSHDLPFSYDTSEIWCDGIHYHLR
jgi:hypothetical protein